MFNSINEEKKIPTRFMLFDARSHTGPKFTIYFTDGKIENDLPENAAICAIIMAHCYNDDFVVYYLFNMSLLLLFSFFVS